ncbi:MAG: peptidoglycan DD-metalloendopeptidase family protein [Magnetococcales bacterium]|nr:peptidoglycan DD-metalloendopeptidase family protein [Magnetococcales bacterium]
MRVVTGPPLAWGMEPAGSIERTGTREYRVKPGDTLWAIAMVHEVDAADLAAWNGIKNPDLLRVGQVLVVEPPAVSEEVPRLEGAGVEGEPISPPGRGLSAGSEVVSEELPGEGSVGGTAARSGRGAEEEPAVGLVSPAAEVVVAEAGSEVSPAVGPEPGGKLGKPVSEDERVAAESTGGVSVDSSGEGEPVVVAAARGGEAASPAGVEPASVKSREEEARIDERVKNSWVLKAGAPKSWSWPLRGKLLTRFGRQGAMMNNGIDIAADPGTPVVAAAAGVVAYADSGLPGYGKLIILRHGGGYMTAYAHNDRLLVDRGTEVKAGERIALSGQSGMAKAPMLHFEMRRQVQPVNPLQYLPRN